jgi:hypothetical protein
MRVCARRCWTRISSFIASPFFPVRCGVVLSFQSSWGLDLPLECLRAAEDGALRCFGRL